MKHIYMAERAEELQTYKRYADSVQAKLTEYMTFLQEQFCVQSFPRAILWTSAEIATHQINDIPLPAYTNDYRTVFCPELDSWRAIYLKQLDSLGKSDVTKQIRNYYETKLTDNHVMQILGHEFVHHSELFLDESYDTGIWFEEGMCEYISRKFFLTNEQFEEEARINALLVNLYSKKYGKHSLTQFGSSTYAGDLAGVFHEYWRSFLAVKQIIDCFDGNIMAVFREYQDGYQSQNKDILLEKFQLDEEIL